MNGSLDEKDSRKGKVENNKKLKIRKKLEKWEILKIQIRENEKSL